ncbi:MAG: Glu/Leu/Phe/Val dehydrogenase, partial [Firmicutes bacterium]|nr:Glu/Leu/Phe/Val dehydrogenase [Bacillota bacterium]
DFGLEFKDIFTRHIYIPAPDMGTGPLEMTQIYNATMDPASVTGKPQGIQGWLPGRKESTGYGVMASTLKAIDILGLDPKSVKVAIQGFGNVGSHTAMFLHEKGIRIVGITDVNGGVYNRDGLDIEELLKYAEKTMTVAGFDGGVPLTNEELFSLDVDILIPAATGHVVNKDTAPTIRAKAVVGAANMPVTPEGMEVLESEGIMFFPDIIANAGGVIASQLEYSGSLSARQRTKERVLEIVAEKIEDAFERTVEIAKQEKVNLTEAAIELAVMRVHDAMVQRGWVSTGTA